MIECPTVPIQALLELPDTLRVLIPIYNYDSVQVSPFGYYDDATMELYRRGDSPFQFVLSGLLCRRRRKAVHLQPQPFCCITPQSPQYLKQTARFFVSTIQGFRTLLQTTYKDGHLPRKTKEIVAVACSVAVQSQSCVIAHVKKAIDAGASKDEILEAGAIGVEMGGGPSLVFAKDAIDVAEALLK